MERVKTIGDAYFAVGGINTRPASIYLSPLLAALKMQEFVRYYNSRLDDIRWELRAGFTVGPVTSGVIGYQKIAYDVWGDTVNLANRLESEADTGCVAVPQKVYRQVRNQIGVRRSDIITSPEWGSMKIYQCEKIPPNLPARYADLVEKIDPRNLLENVFSEKSLLDKLFQLPSPPAAEDTDPES